MTGDALRAVARSRSWIVKVAEGTLVRTEKKGPGISPGALAC
jgi:hypothetical protein